MGSEAAAWRHPAWIGGDLPLLPGDPAVLAELRRGYAAAPAAERDLAWRLILAQQQAFATPPAARMEERALRAALLGASDAAAEAWFRGAREVLAALGPDRAADRDEVRRWVNRWAGRAQAELWRHGPALLGLWRDLYPDGPPPDTPWPPGLEAAWLQAQARDARPAAARTLRLCQFGALLHWRPATAPGAELATGSPVVQALTTRLPVVAVRERRADAPWTSLPVPDGPGLSADGPGWLLRSEQEALTIAPLERPDWALAMGRDGDGLFVDFADDDGAGAAPVAPSAPAGVLAPGQRRAFWCAPLDWLAWPGAPAPGQRPERTPWDEHGCFIDADQWRLLKTRGLAPWPGLGSLTWDRFGARWVIRIKDVEIALRWLWPGEFLMGSPPDEAGRYNDERQHRVILTRGFWLAETACTQALWQAVMGQNPSYQKGPEWPVHNVSWHDAQGLVERLNEALDGLLAATPGQPEQARPAGAPARFRLPTEAEWEYACRAGTVTAYAFGDRFNANLANNGGNTVPVRSLPPNPWGFYEMHCNVWEWCQDWFGDYPDGPVLDPNGPATGGRRVLRSGLWRYGERYQRSAYRHSYDPRGRFNSSGLRLALGPELGRAGSGGQPVGGAGPSARGASASERTAR